MILTSVAIAATLAVSEARIALLRDGHIHVYTLAGQPIVRWPAESATNVTTSGTLVAAWGTERMRGWEDTRLRWETRAPNGTVTALGDGLVLELGANELGWRDLTDGEQTAFPGTAVSLGARFVRRCVPVDPGGAVVCSGDPAAPSQAHPECHAWTWNVAGLGAPTRLDAPICEVLGADARGVLGRSMDGTLFWTGGTPAAPADDAALGPTVIVALRGEEFLVTPRDGTPAWSFPAVPPPEHPTPGGLVASGRRIAWTFEPATGAILAGATATTAQRTRVPPPDVVTTFVDGVTAVRHGEFQTDLRGHRIAVAVVEGGVIVAQLGGDGSVALIGPRGIVWDRHIPWLGDAVVQDGALFVVVTGRGVARLDIATGEALWATGSDVHHYPFGSGPP